MTKYFRTGDRFRVSQNDASDIRDLLPAQNYILNIDDHGFYLEYAPNFPIPEKIYGDIQTLTDRVINTFLSRPKSTGVMLMGEKGSGKTLQSQHICQQASAKHKVPTIIINSPFSGASFNKFIQNIEQPCIVLFDEFEKMYKDPEESDDMGQVNILTLFDGVFPSKKLFMLTCNDKWRIDEHMRNRPGRIFYSVEYKGLFFKSFEGELVQSGFRSKSGTETSSFSNTWKFSASDPTVAKQLEDLGGKHIKLYYHQWMIKPMYQETNYTIYKVEEVK